MPTAFAGTARRTNGKLRIPLGLPLRTPRFLPPDTGALAPTRAAQTGLVFRSLLARVLRPIPAAVPSALRHSPGDVAFAVT